jgi:hypothetical protein
MLMGKSSTPSWRNASSEFGEGETEQEIGSGTQGFQCFALRCWVPHLRYLVLGLVQNQFGWLTVSSFHISDFLNSTEKG